MKKKFNTNFAKVLKKSKFSESELARVAGVNPGAITNLKENGIRSIKCAKKYAQFLGVEPFCIIEIQ